MTAGLFSGEHLRWVLWYLLPGFAMGLWIALDAAREGRLPRGLQWWAVALAALVIAPFWLVIVLQALRIMLRTGFRRVVYALSLLEIRWRLWRIRSLLKRIPQRKEGAT